MTLASPIPARIQLCGPPVIELDGQRLEDRLAGHQSVLLFAYLVLHRHQLSSRDDLERALWADGLAHPSGLNPLISKLRKVLGAGLLEGRSGLRLRLPNPALVDVEAARSAVHTAESQIALEHWKHAWAPAQVACSSPDGNFYPGSSPHGSRTSADSWRTSRSAPCRRTPRQPWAVVAPSFRPPSGAVDVSSSWPRSTRADTKS